jgi:outer membrane protein TolC
MVNWWLYRKFVSVLPLAVILVMGCTEQYNTKLHQKNYDDINNVRLASFSESSATQQPETVQISEPNGVLTLSQALALALMKNPELKSFSLQVRISQARELQASLWPNPELEVEVEEVGGTGRRSRFDAAETTIQLSQLIELGDKRTKRTRLASLEKELAGSDYEAKRLDVFTEVTKAFIEVLKNYDEKLEALTGKIWENEYLNV